MGHYVYILQSEKDGRYYVGYSSHPELRVLHHNEGWTRSTKGRGEWRIVHVEEHPSKSEAIKRERAIKRRKSRKYIEKLIHAEGRPVTPEA